MVMATSSHEWALKFLKEQTALDLASSPGTLVVPTNAQKLVPAPADQKLFQNIKINILLSFLPLSLWPDSWGHKSKISIPMGTRNVAAALCARHLRLVPWDLEKRLPFKGHAVGIGRH